MENWSIKINAITSDGVHRIALSHAFTIGNGQIMTSKRIRITEVYSLHSYVG